MIDSELLAQYAAELKALQKRLAADQEEAGDRFVAMRNDVNRFLPLLQLYLVSPHLLTRQQRAAWGELFLSMKENTEHYSDSHSGLHITENGRVRSRLSDELAALMQKMAPVVERAVNAMKIDDRFQDSFRAGTEDRVIASLDDYLTSAGLKMRPENCFFKPEDLRFEDETLFGRMVWLGRQEAADRALGERPQSTTIYREAFRTINRELKNASLPRQMAFARQLERYRVALIDKLADNLARYRAEEADEPHIDAAVRLYNDPDYLRLESLSVWEESLDAGAKAFEENFRSSAEYLNRPSVAALQNYMPGSPFLTPQQRQQADAQREAANKAELNESSYRAYPASVRPLFEAYGVMMRDNEPASRYFNAMRDNLGRFLSLNHANISDTTAYHASLSVALQTVRAYLETHPGSRVHRNGNLRCDAAREARDALTALNETLERQMEENRAGMAPVMEGEAKDEQQLEMRQLSRLHNLTSAHFVPTPRRVNFEQGRVSRFVNGTFHYIGSAVVLLGSVISFIPWGISRLRHLNFKAEVEQRDYNRIPGLENREQFLPVDPDKGSANQPVLSDVRRQPLVWEKSTVGDPNQPPTITICSMQSAEDKPDAGDNGYTNTGHAYMVLEYTRNDPVTGKPQRYRTAFGFYPDMSESNMENFDAIAASGGKGGFVPGVLQDDSDADAHAGITFTANNRQINKVLLAAQQFEKGGYNVATRNCTDFVKEMADTAGLDTKSLFQKMDFDTGFIRTLGTALSLPFYDYFRIHGNGVLRKRSGQTERANYQTLGQKRISDEDIRHFNKSELNMRLRGYNPSRLAEAIKSSGRGNLAQNNLEFEHEPDFMLEGNVSIVYDEQVREKNNALKAEIARFCQNRGLDSEPLQEQLDAILSDHIDLAAKLENGFDIEPKKREGHLENGVVTDFTYETADEQYQRNLKNLQESIQDLSSIREKLEHYYKTVLHGAPELYTHVQHLTAVFDYMQRKAEMQLSRLDMVTALYTRPQGQKMDLEKEIDQSREDSSALLKFRFGEITDSHVRIPIPVLAASALVYQDFHGTPSFGSDMEKIDRLREKKDNEGLTAEEKKELKKCEARTAFCRKIAHSMSYYAGAKSFTKGDIGFIFGTLQKFSYETMVRGIVDPFAGFAWNHVLTPTKQPLKDTVLKKLTDLQSQKNSGFDAAKWSKEISAGIVGVIAGSMSGHSEEMREILRAITQAYSRKAQDLPDTPEELRAAKNAFLQGAAEDVAMSLMNGRFRSQCLDAIGEALEKTGFGSREEKLALKNVLMMQVNTDLLTALFSAMRTIDPQFTTPMLQNAPLAAELQQPAQQLAFVAQTMHDTPNYLDVLESMLPAMRSLNTKISEISAKREPERRPAEQQQQKGAKEVLQQAKMAVKELADQATLERQSFERSEMQHTMRQIAKVSFVAFLNKLTPENRDKVLQKIGSETPEPDPGARQGEIEESPAYERYINRIAKTDAFKSILKNPRPVDVNSLVSKNGFENLMNRCNAVFSAEFIKKVHISNVKSPAPEHQAHVKPGPAPAQLH